MKKVYLFRHGETDWNKAGKVQCSMDIELNLMGLTQAEKNADMLKDKGIQHIYSSPLKRAYKTAEVLANLTNIEIETFSDLGEMNGGKYEGMLVIEFRKDFGEENFELYHNTKNEGMELRFPSGETKRETRNRISNAIKNICEATQHNIIGISTHGFVLREFLRFCDFEDDTSVTNCEIIEAEYENNEIKVLKRIKEVIN